MIPLAKVLPKYTYVENEDRIIVRGRGFSACHNRYLFPQVFDHDPSAKVRSFPWAYLRNNTRQDACHRGMHEHEDYRRLGLWDQQDGENQFGSVIKSASHFGSRF